MTKTARRSHHPKRPTATSSPTASGTGGFWRMVGNSESINGMPNGIFGVALARRGRAGPLPGDAPGPLRPQTLTAGTDRHIVETGVWSITDTNPPMRRNPARSYRWSFDGFVDSR